MTSQDRFEHLDGAYAFGALDAAEAAEFETHLATCSECAARVATARSLAALLADITEDEIRADVPDTLLPGLLRRAAASRRRQRWLVSGLAAVAAACLITLTVLVWPSSPSAPAGRTIALSAVVTSPVKATVELIQTSSGTQIKLHCTYVNGSGGENNVWYGLDVVDKNGTHHPLSTWTLEPGEDQVFPATTALPESQISHLDVTYHGHAILTATL